MYQAIEQTVGVNGNQIIYFDDRQCNIQGAANRNWNAYKINAKQSTAKQIRLVLTELGLITDRECDSA